MSRDDPLVRPATYDELYDGDGNPRAALGAPAPRESARIVEPAPYARPLAPTSRLVVTPAADVEPTAPVWHWRGWLVAGAVHLGIGRQGAGKTTFAEWILARATTGQPWPGEEACREPLRCGVLSLEEPADRLVARLHAAQARIDHAVVLGDVEVIDDEGRSYRRPWRLPADCPALADAIADQHLGLVVVDGLGYAVTGDSHNYANVGSALAALASVAERTGCAIVGLTHPPKGASDPVTAGIGSTAWTAIPRLTWVLGVDPDHEDRRVVRVAKTNFVEPPCGWSFRIGSDERYEAGYVTELRRSSVAAEQLVGLRESAEERDERTEARGVVRELLAGGPLLTADFDAGITAAGLTRRTVERVRRDLGVVSRPQRDADTGRVTGWIVALPDHEGAPHRQPAVGGLGGVGPTRDFASSTRPDRHNPDGGGLVAPAARAAVPEAGRDALTESRDLSLADLDVFAERGLIPRDEPPPLDDYDIDRLEALADDDAVLDPAPTPAPRSEPATLDEAAALVLAHFPGAEELCRRCDAPLRACRCRPVAAPREGGIR